MLAIPVCTRYETTGYLTFQKTTNGGLSWTRTFEADVRENPSSTVNTIEIHPNDDSLIMLGTSANNAAGSLYWSRDAGDTWTKVTTGTSSIQARAVIGVKDSTQTVFYAGCDIQTGASAGVKTITYDTAAKTMTYDDTMKSVLGSAITDFAALAFAVSSANHVFAAGKTGTNQPRVYVKVATSKNWISTPSAGLPASGSVSAITIGKDSSGNEIPIIAIGEALYYLDASGWHKSTSYAVGTEINCLYWDDLLIGTSAGLYGQNFAGKVSAYVPTTSTAPSVRWSLTMMFTMVLLILHLQ